MANPELLGEVPLGDQTAKTSDNPDFGAGEFSCRIGFAPMIWLQARRNCVVGILARSDPFQISGSVVRLTTVTMVGDVIGRARA